MRIVLLSENIAMLKLEECHGMSKEKQGRQNG